MSTIAFWICPVCGTVYNENVKRCWRCGRGQGVEGDGDKEEPEEVEA